MAQQMLTLAEIRSLLARQSDQHHSFEHLHHPDDQQQQPPLAGQVSLEGGKRIVQSIQHDPRIDDTSAAPGEGVQVGDVISSVRTIMASQMASAQVSQPSPVVVVAEQEQPASDGPPAAVRDDHHHHGHHHPDAVFEPLPADNVGLLATNSHQVAELNDLAADSNRLAWRVWSAAMASRSAENNEVFSPLSLASALGIAFLGARGQTADAVDSLLGLDRLTSRNPHLHLQQVARDLDTNEHFRSALTHSVYVDQPSKDPPSKGSSGKGSSSSSSVSDIFRARLDTLYGASLASSTSQVQQTVRKSFYPLAGDSQQPGPDDADLLRPPFGIISTASLNVAWPSFTDKPATAAGSAGVQPDSGDHQHLEEEDDGLLQFLNLPSAAHVSAPSPPPPSARRLVPVPAIRTTGHFYAGYDSELDATVVALPLHPIRDGTGDDLPLGAEKPNEEALDQAGHLSLIVVLPGTAAKFQAGGSGLVALEGRLAERADGWDHLLRQTSVQHLQVEMPQLLGQQSRFNLTGPLMAAGGPIMAGLFDPKSADFGGVSTAIRPLYLADMIQMARLNITSVAALPAGRNLFIIFLNNAGP